MKPSRLSRRSGVSLIWVSFSLFLFIVLIGLAIDSAYYVLVKHQLQNAADAAALAGAHEVRANRANARQQAVDTGLANEAAQSSVRLDPNGSNAATGDVVFGRYDRSSRTFTPQTTSVNAARVNARRTAGSLGGPLALLFGPTFGVDTAEVGRTATAMIAGGIGAGVIALNPTESCSFDLRGTSGSLIVNDGVIYVNSDDPESACHAGKPTLVAEELYVTGDADKKFEDQVDFTGDLYYGRDPIPDPLADLPEPTWDPANDLGTVWVDGGITLSITPGFYSGGITVRNGRLECAPGVYVLDGAGLDDNGGDLIAEGVMFFITGTGFVDLRGNGEIRITPPDDNEYTYPPTPDIIPYSEAGVSLFQARDNTNPSRILGTNQLSFEGTLYFPAAQLEIGGTSDSLGNGLIADTILAHGNGDLVINYDDRFPPVPRFVFLVE